MVEMNEGVAALGGKAGNAAIEDPVTQLASDLPGGRSVTDQTDHNELASLIYIAISNCEWAM
jgi:hypothetical protein